MAAGAWPAAAQAAQPSKSSSESGVPPHIPAAQAIRDEIRMVKWRMPGRSDLRLPSPSLDWVSSMIATLVFMLGVAFVLAGIIWDQKNAH